MLRQSLKDNAFLGDKAFRWRGGEVSRLEGISDAVFAFAITLLVVSLEVPQTFQELVAAMQGFFGFAVCFAALIAIWYAHYIYFRRFGFEDGPTIVINAVLLFVILFYIYPMKFLVGFLITLFFGDGQGVFGNVIQPEEVPALMITYSVGYIAILAIFLLLYRRAWRFRDALELNPVEVFLTRQTMLTFAVMIGVGMLSVVLAAIASVTKSGLMMSLSGFCYWITWPATAILHRGEKQRIDALREAD